MAYLMPKEASESSWSNREESINARKCCSSSFYHLIFSQPNIFYNLSLQILYMNLKNALKASS